MKHLYASLSPCRKEEEVKAEFCKFFKMKIFALRGIDHYTERVLFEFKYDCNFRNAGNVARVLAQVMYYARMLKYGAGLTRYPLPPFVCVVDKNEAFFAETRAFSKFYSSKSDRYDWDRAPSTPCPNLVQDILEFLVGHKEHKEHKGFVDSVPSVAEKNKSPLCGLKRTKARDKNLPRWLAVSPPPSQDARYAGR